MTLIFSYPSRTLFAAALLSAAAFGQGQSPEHSPFHDRADTGETIHVLPAPASIRSPRDTQPSIAPPTGELATYVPSYGSGKLVDHGGLEIGSAGYYAIYWNSSVAFSPRTSLGYSSIQTQIQSFVAHFAANKNYSRAANDDYTIVQQYGTHRAIADTFLYRGTLIDTKATQSSITDSSLRSYLVSKFTSGAVSPRGDTIYGIYLPSGMKVTMSSGAASCTSFCGYHSALSYNGIQVKYAVYPFPDCGGCSMSGLTVADMLTIIGSHEIREAVTDPGDNGWGAWWDAAGYEADDKCAWHNLYKMSNGGFWVQPEYSNGGTVTASGFTATYPGPGCIVPNK